MNANVVVSAAQSTPRTSPRRFLAVVGAIGFLSACLAVTVPLRADAAPAAPAAPTAVSTTLTNNGARATVKWTNPTTGGPLTYDVITLIDVTGSSWFQYGVGARCYGCTSYTLDALLAGRTYWAVIQPAGPGGGGPLGFSVNTVTGGQPSCTSAGFEACISVNTSDTAGTMNHPAAGLLNATDTSNSTLNTVAPTWWRYNTGSVTNPNYNGPKKAAAAGATTIEDLSLDWTATYVDPTTGYIEAPWTNDYADWDAFVQAKVARSEADNQAPDYWEVWNEPGGNIPNLGSTNQMAFTPDVQLALYQHTWNDLHAVDPNAKIAGMSTVGLHDHADEIEANASGSFPGQVALDQFLAFLQANNLTVDLLTWHDSGVAGWLNVDALPASRIRREVGAAQAMLNAAGMGNVPIVLDEYTSPTDHSVPAWTLDYMTGIESSGAAGGMRACWWDKDPSGASTTTYDGCTWQSTDNLLTPAVTTFAQPRSTLWVYDYYRQMTGNRLNLVSSSDWVSGVASSSGSNNVSVMFGRHWTCLPGSNPNCAYSAIGIPAPANEQVTVTLPNGNWTVTAKSIPPVWGALNGPVTKSGVVNSVSVTNGKATITVPSVADGEVVTLTLSHR